MVKRKWKRPNRWAVSLLILVSASVGTALTYLRNAKQIELASEFRRDGQLQRADAILSQCLSLPGQSDVIQLEWRLGAVQQGDLRDESALQETAKVKSEASWRILESLCKGNMAVFKWNEARQYAEEMLGRRPEDARALWLRGRCWVKLQQETKALDDFRQAASAAPWAWEYRLSLAELLQLQGYNSEAKKYYRELVQERQFDERILIGLARCLHDAAELEEAKRTLEFLLGLQPQSEKALIALSRLGLRQGDPAKAEAWARTAASKAPRNQEVNFVLSLCLTAQGKQDTELEQRVIHDDRIRVELKKQLRESSTDPAALCQVGAFMLATGEVEEGLGCYQRAINADRKNKAAHEALADYFHRSGQLHRALEHRRIAGGEQIRVGSELAEPVKASARSLDFQTVVGPADVNEATSEEVHQLCAVCHAYPPPNSFPKSAWRKEVQLGYDFFWDSSLSGKFPSLESVVRYYEYQAPSQLAATTTTTGMATAATAPLTFHFEVAGSGWLANTQPFPATTHIGFVQLTSKKKNLDLLVCDARLDQLLLLNTEKNPPEWSVLGPVLVPSHAEVVDLDGDGNRDVIVASLGQFFPTDDRVGSVVWLRASPSASNSPLTYSPLTYSPVTYSPVTLLEGVGRVADVRPADFNGDGLIDLVVAVFGWRKGGEILYMENKTIDWSKPVFETHKIDKRHGASHVPVADLNKDGLPDFVALISQEHETVVAFLNEGKGQFRQEQIFAAPHPAYGCSGIELVDMDGDKDLDVLLTNGDVLDRPYILKPYHGVQWLENSGGYPFKHHPIASMHGASKAVAADMDGDSDIDVIAVSFLPAQEFPAREQQRIPSAMLFEQTSSGNFASHVLEAGSCDHFTCAVADWNIDGKVDFALGNFSWKRSQAIPDAMLLLKNVAD